MGSVVSSCFVFSVLSVVELDSVFWAVRLEIIQHGKS